MSRRQRRASHFPAFSIPNRGCHVRVRQPYQILRWDNVLAPKSLQQPHRDPRCSGMRGTWFSTLWSLLVEGVNAFIEDEALTRGAAIAFYIVTAIAPTLFI